MNPVTYRITLDMLDTVSQRTIKAKKGDSNCEIQITLTKNGKVFQLDEDCYAIFSAKKSDGNFINNDCTIEGNVITYDFASSFTTIGEDDEKRVCQISAVEGNVDCDVTVFNAEGKQLTSSRFVLYIDGTVYNGEEILSSSSGDALGGLVGKAQESIKKVEEIIEKGAIQGEKGDPFTYEDFTPEQLASLKGEQGKPFTYEDFTEEQLAALKGKDGVDGKDGKSFTYDDFTDEQLAKLKGEKGDPFTYEDFTPEQLETLKGDKGDTPDLSGYATKEELEAKADKESWKLIETIKCDGTRANYSKSGLNLSALKIVCSTEVGEKSFAGRLNINNIVFAYFTNYVTTSKKYMFVTIDLNNLTTQKGIGNYNTEVTATENITVVDEMLSMESITSYDFGSYSTTQYIPANSVIEIYGKDKV